MENFLLPLAIPSREVNSHALYSPTLIRIACRIGTTIRLQIKSKLLTLRLINGIILEIEHLEIERIERMGSLTAQRWNR